MGEGMEGWLSKRGPVGNYKWQRRYCVLSDGSLEYFDGDEREVKKGEVELGPRSQAVPFKEQGAPGEAAKHVSEKPFGFVIDVDPSAGRNRHLYYFDAADEPTLTLWVDAIKLAALALSDGDDCGPMDSSESTADTAAPPSEAPGEEPGTSPPPPTGSGLAAGKAEKGEWDYVVVAPEAKMYFEKLEQAKSKLPRTLTSGEVVVVTERERVKGVLWLYVQVEQGWIPEYSTKRWMSQIIYEEPDSKITSETVVILPTLKTPQVLRPTILAPISSTNVTSAQDSLHAGVEVQVEQKARILKPCSGAKKEEWHSYTKVSDGKLASGWLPDVTASGEKVLVIAEVQTEFYISVAGSAGEEATDSAYISVLPSKTPCPLFEQPGKSAEITGKTLSSGDFEKIMLKLTAGGLTFYKLETGNWVCDTDKVGKPIVDLVLVQSHEYIYVCHDKDGTVIRKVPTRETEKNCKKHLKFRQRALVSNKAIFTNGDVFLQLQPPSHEGWVPMNKKGGGEKMKAIQPIKASKEEKPPPQQQQPGGQPVQMLQPMSMGRPMQMVVTTPMPVGAPGWTTVRPPVGTIGFSQPGPLVATMGPPMGGMPGQPVPMGSMGGPYMGPMDGFSGGMGPAAMGPPAMGPPAMGPPGAMGGAPMQSMGPGLPGGPPGMPPPATTYAPLHVEEFQGGPLRSNY